MRTKWMSVLQNEEDDLLADGFYTGWTVRRRGAKFIVARFFEKVNDTFTTREEARAYAEVCYLLGVHRGA